MTSCECMNVIKINIYYELEMEKLKTQQNVIANPNLEVNLKSAWIRLKYIKLTN